MYNYVAGEATKKVFGGLLFLRESGDALAYHSIVSLVNSAAIFTNTELHKLYLPGSCSKPSLIERFVQIFDSSNA